MCELLLKKGADAAARNAELSTPAHQAAIGGHANVTLQGGSKFDGLNFRLERLSESPVDHPVQGVLELLQQTHPWMLLPRPRCAVEPDRSAQGQVVGSPTMTEMRACTLSTLPTAVGWARVAE